jgi:phytanoyl-CoA hydroxylase
MPSINFKSLKTSFDQDGYVFIPGFLTKEEVDLTNKKLETYIKEALPKMSPKHVFYEDINDPSTLKQMQNLFAYDPYFLDLLKGSKFEKIAEVLLEDKVIGKEVEFFNKPPRIGKPTPPHQDNYYFNLKPPKAVTMWMALENVDMENGCLHYVRGSHLKGLRPHGRTKTLGFSQGITDFGEEDVANEIAFPAKPGDLLIHHSLTIHRADGNNSDLRSRRALGFIYFAKSAKVDEKSMESYKEQLKRV